MTPAHPLYNLLHDWSNHEPDRVLLTIGSTIAVRVQGNAFGVSMPGVLLAAVIEAIEAEERMWCWVLRTSLEEYTARVSYPIDDVYCDGDTPAAALLGAYLAALEADASTEARAASTEQEHGRREQ